MGNGALPIGPKLPSHPRLYLTGSLRRYTIPSAGRGTADSPGAWPDRRDSP